MDNSSANCFCQHCEPRCPYCGRPYRAAPFYQNVPWITHPWTIPMESPSWICESGEGYIARFNSDSAEVH